MEKGLKNPIRSLMGSLPQRYAVTRLASVTATNFPQIFLGEFLWEAIDAEEVRPGVIGSKRPSKPKDQERLGLTTELWWMLTKCWQRDPEDRIAVPDILNFLLYM